MQPRAIDRRQRAVTRSTRSRYRPPWLPAAVLAVLAAACGSGSGPSPTAGGTPGPTPGQFTAGELRLLLVDRLGPRWYCDQDEYPVGRDEQQSAIENWPQVIAEGETFRAVAERLDLDPNGDFSDAEKVAVWRLWKVAASIPFEAVPSGDGYRFDFLTSPAPGATEGTRTVGLVDTMGAMTIESRTAAGEPMCPICLVRGTLVDTPTGAVPVEDLQVGLAIWTLDATGRRIAGTVTDLGSMSAPATHRAIRLVLADGRAMTASPGHPLADGRTLAQLRVGDLVDGSAVVSLTWLPYAGGWTYDLVVSGETGTYFVAGIPTASTIRPAAVVPAGG